jgi:hypothetical protein
LTAAKAFALRNLEAVQQPIWRDAARHRLARLEKKMTRERSKLEVGSQNFEF